MGDSPTQKPAHVRVVGITSGPGFHSGHDSFDAATAAAETANSAASDLAVQARYEAVDAPFAA